MADYGDYNCRRPRPCEYGGRDRFRSAASPLPANPSVTMLYVPVQTDTEAFEDCAALEYGTLFKVLYKPFEGKRCR